MKNMDMFITQSSRMASEDLEFSAQIKWTALRCLLWYILPFSGALQPLVFFHCEKCAASNMASTTESLMGLK